MKMKNFLTVKNANMNSLTGKSSFASATLSLLCLVFITSISFPAFAQNGVKIAAASGTANASAMLDVESTTKGALLPRMTSGQRTAIAAPAVGLIVYQTDAPAGFYSYNGSVWTIMTGADNLGNHTATTTLNMNTNVINAIRRLEFYNVGGNSGEGDNSYSIFQEGGAWTHPYPDLRIAYHTGIKLGANSSYNGIRFYNDYNMATQTFSVGDGDNNARAYYNLLVTGNVGIGNTAPAAKLHISAGDASYALYGPNSTWGAYLYVGAGTNTVSSGRAQVISTNGNLHLDAGTTQNIYIANYTGTNTFMQMGGGNVGIGTTSPGFKLHVPSGYIGTDYFNSTDNVVSSGVTGIMVKQGDNYHRTADAAAIRAFLGSTGSDNLGNHTATTTLNMNNQSISNISDMYATQNYGRVLVGVYDASRYQNVFSMGTSWRLAADGTTPGNLYGLAWTHTNVGGQSKGGLSHQMLVMENGVTKVALGTGIWMQGDLTFNSANPYLSASSYFVAPGGAYFNSGTVYFEAATQMRGGIQNDGANFSGRVYIHDDIQVNGWARTNGQAGWYSETYGGGIWMQDGTWVRRYGANGFLSQSSGNPALRGDQANCGYYAAELYACGSTSAGLYVSGYTYSYTNYTYSTKTKKNNIEKFQPDDYNSSLAFMDKLNLNYYKFKDETEYPKTHVGLIAEETPTTLTAPGKAGVSYGELAAFNTGAIKALKKKVEVIEKQNKNISDFGAESISSSQLWVKFSEDFKGQLNGAQPVVTVSPSQLGVSMRVSRRTQEGFMVEVAPQNGAVSFDWIAMAKVETRDNVNVETQMNSKFANMIQSAENDTRPIPKLSVVNNDLPVDFVGPEKTSGNNKGITSLMDSNTPTLAKFPVVAPVKEGAPAPAAQPVGSPKEDNK